ncbi:dTMP kinase [bacterium]
MQKKGFFITMEGIDGCGKSTQTQLLVQYLNKHHNHTVIKTKEPGGGPASEKIRYLLLAKDTDISALTELLLLEASRTELFSTTIIPALNEGKTIVCERGIDSTIAYQGYARGLDHSIIKTLNQTASQNIKPDVTIIFDIDPLKSQTRIKAGDQSLFDRLEKEGIEFQKKVRNGFLEIAKQEPDRIKIINIENKSINEVHEETIEIIKGLKF